MEGRERALMRASVSLQLLISTLKKHDLDAPLMLDDPRATELLRQLHDSLQEAQVNKGATAMIDLLNSAITEGPLLRSGSVRAFLATLRNLDANLHQAGEKRAPLRVV